MNQRWTDTGLYTTLAIVIDSEALETGCLSLARYQLPRTKRHGITSGAAWQFGNLRDGRIVSSTPYNYILDELPKLRTPCTENCFHYHCLKEPRYPAGSHHPPSDRPICYGPHKGHIIDLDAISLHIH